ncbi:MAG: phosphatidylserine/phosphatidylglycerophosphate/cardiolipin synthase family protein [Actinobacteria bacterium]|nr:phosphatidylserine/phosphatidylglycerophosphate/cardiolipin synthase family protein [Actinomycetota bacterium]
MGGRGQVGRLAVAVATLVFGLEAAVVSGIYAARYSGRKHRPAATFPVLPPVDTDAAGAEITVYTYGRDLYRDMLSAIADAREVIYFETFIWKGDEVGAAFKEALIAAADRGVKVCVMFDTFANLVVRPSFYSFPPSILVRRHPMFGGGGLHALDPRNSGRDHRKILVVDHEVGFLGGYNIGALYEKYWRDTHVRLRGPVVADLDFAFVDLWNSGPGGHRPQLPAPPRTWDSRITIHRNLPRYLVYPIRNMYLEAIERATSRVLMTHAYFIPDADLTRSLLNAAERGVEVSIILPDQSNHALADWMSRGCYDELLAGGVKLHLYQNAMIHSKTATIDGVWSTVGTANLDRLSLAGNYEVNVEIFSEDVAATLEQVFANDLQNCVELTSEEWRRRSLAVRLSERVIAPFRPLV